MMRELRYLQQDHAANVHKRWFQDDYFDLFTWQDDTGQVTGFQLCYDRMGRERVIQWNCTRGFQHHQIDDGETSPTRNMTPVFIEQISFPYEEVIPLFIEHGEEIDTTIYGFIIQKLIEYLNN